MLVQGSVNNVQEFVNGKCCIIVNSVFKLYFKIWRKRILKSTGIIERQKLLAMGKRSKKSHSSRHEKDQAGCIKGLINIFDFRHGRSTKRLMIVNKQVDGSSVGDGDSSNQIVLQDQTRNFENIANDEENEMPLVNICKTSVKKLMEEEMFSEKGPTKQQNDSESDSKYEQRNYKKNNGSCNKSGVMDVNELEVVKCSNRERFHAVLEQKPSDNLDIRIVIEELSQIYQRNTLDFHNNLDVPSGQASTVEENIVAAVKLFTEQKLSEAENCSNDIMLSLQTLSTNKSLLLKLLRDPNSVLVKHIKNFEDARLMKDQTPGSLSEEKNSILNSDRLSSRTHHNFFRRRSKSLESFLLGEDENGQSSNKIVILKPGPVGSPSPNERNASQFSFTEIKRKLRHAMGKERHGISPNGLMLKMNASPKHQNRINGEKGVIGEYFGWSSPNRNHFYTERFTKVCKSKDNGSEMVDGVSNINIEAKKHLSEIVNNDNAESMTGQLSESLGRILSLPDYNSSPCCSPTNDSGENLITTQIRPSPCSIEKNNVSGLLQENQKNYSSPDTQSLGLESQWCTSCTNFNDEEQSPIEEVDLSLTSNQEYSLGVPSSTEDLIISEVSMEIEETTESKPQAEESISNFSSELERNSVNGDITNEVDIEKIASDRFEELDIFEEDEILSSQTVSTSCSPVNREVEDSENSIDKLEQPSPVSVLEPLFTDDDDITPARVPSQPVKRQIQPRHIHFEEQSSSSIDQGSCIRISPKDEESFIRFSPKDEESAFEYVEAVLLGSGLDWDEFLLRWLSFNDILDSSLFEEVELFSSRSFNDQKLLFASTNEALKEICETYFGCFSGISRVKQNIQPVPKGIDLIYEVCKRVEWHFFQHPYSHSLDQLVQRDMEMSNEWMNLKSDIELIGYEMEETIFDELVEDTLLIFTGVNS